jgi:hypothetical protein
MPTQDHVDAGCCLLFVIVLSGVFSYVGREIAEIVLP